MKGRSIRTRPAEVEDTPVRYPGFAEGGVFFWSDTPVTNSSTNWVRDMCKRVPRELLSPAQVVDSLRFQPKWIQGLLGSITIGDWSRWDRFSDWPMAFCSNSVGQAIKHWGQGEAPWFKNDKRWAEMCDEAEFKNGQTPRAEGIVDRDSGKLVDQLSEKLS